MLCVRPASQALLPPLTAEAPPEETAVVRAQRLGLSEGPTRLSSQTAFPEGSSWSASDVGQYSLPFLALLSKQIIYEETDYILKRKRKGKELKQ